MSHHEPNDTLHEEPIELSKFKSLKFYLANDKKYSSDINGLQVNQYYTGEIFAVLITALQKTVNSLLTR